MSHSLNLDHSRVTQKIVDDAIISDADILSRNAA
jgi:hypothetical protein